MPLVKQDFKEMNYNFLFENHIKWIAHHSLADVTERGSSAPCPFLNFYLPLTSNTLSE